VDWTSTIKSSALATDTVSLIFFNEAEKEAVLKENCAIRTATTVEVVLPTEWATGKVHCWIYFSTADGSRNSVSQYISEVQL
jgi:hypothetical protein